MREVCYFGDGDSKVYAEVNSLNIYGEDTNIEKLECIGHVQKRMETRFRTLVRDVKGKMLSDKGN